MKKVLAIMMSLVMVLQLSPMTALALPSAGISETMEAFAETNEANVATAETHISAEQVVTTVNEAEPAPAVLPVMNTTASDHTHEGWTEWTDATKLPSSGGKYYLSTDVTYEIKSAKTAISADITLCLNGHKIKTDSHTLGDSSGYGEIYRTNTAANITLCDCQKTGVIEGNGKTAGMIYTGSASTAKVTICDITFKNTQGPGGNAVQMSLSNGSASLEMTNVTFDTCKSKAFSPVYLNSKTGTALIKNCTFKNCSNSTSSTSTSSCIYVCAQSGASNTIEGCTFTDDAGQNTNGGGAIYLLGKLNIVDTKFSNVTNTAQGGAIYVGGSAVLNVTDSEFTGCKALGGAGGAIYVAVSASAGGKATIKGTSFTSCSATGNGAAITTASSSSTIFTTCEIDNCTFTGNTGKTSTIYGGTYAVVKVKDTTITGNTATDAGGYTGALYTTGSTFVIEGATIVKDNFNGAATPAPADFILQNATSTFTLKDATEETYLNLKTFQKSNKEKGATLGSVVSGGLLGTYNWTTEPEAGVVVGVSEGTIKLMDLATAISLPATMRVQQPYTGTIEAIGIAPADSYAAPITWTSSDDTIATVVSASPSTATINGVGLGEVIITAALTDDPTVTASCTVTITDKHVHDDTTEYLPWTSTNSLPQSGNYYLTEDVTISGNQNVITGDVRLCMNGHIIKTQYAGSGVKYGELFRNNGAYRIEIVSCEDGATIKATGANYAAIYLSATATAGIYLENIKFTGFTSAGAAITLNGTGSSTIKNCTFEKNISTADAVVYGNGTGVTATFDNCTFTGNQGKNGAAMHIRGTWNLKDCTITGNKATGESAVYVASGALNITGNTRIIGNAYTSGGVSDIAVKSGLLSLKNLGDDAVIGISVPDTAAAGDIIATSGGPTDNVASKIIVEKRGTDVNRSLSDFVASQEDSTVTLAALPAHTHESGTVGEGLTWTGWVDATKLPSAAGNYVLLTDVNIEASASNPVSGDINFCLNGHTIKVKNTTGTTGYGELFRLPTSAAATVTACNCSKEGGITGTGDTMSLFYAGTSATGKFIIDNITFNNISGSGGCAISVNSSTGSATAKVTDCTFKDCEAKDFGIVYSNSPAVDSLILDGCTFENVKNETSANGACIHLAKAVQSATIQYSNFKKCEALSGTALYSLASGTETAPAQIAFEYNRVFECKTALKDGTSSTPNGGLVYLSNESGATENQIAHSDFVSNEVVAKSNASTAGVYVVQGTDKGSTLIKSCAFAKNKVTGSGAMAVTLGGGKSNVKLESVLIEENSSTNTSGNYIGAVYVTNATDKLTLSGNITIDNNYVNNGTLERNIYLQNEAKIYVDNLTTGTNVSITARTGDYINANKLIAVPEGQAIPTTWEDWIMFDSYGTYVRLDSSKTVGNEFYFDRTHTHCLCGDSCGEGCDHTSQKWILWMKSDELPTLSGYYALTSDVVLSSAALVSTAQDIHLCFNGHTVSSAEGVVCRGYEISNGAKLSLSDCHAQLHDGIYSAGGFNGITNSAIYMGSGTTSELNVYDACFTNNTRDNVGSVIYVGKKAIANIYMADISNNVAQSGPVYVQANATINIHNGLFHNNDAGEGWGGFMVVSGGKANITGGEFYNNTVTYDSDSRRGGAIYFIDGTDDSAKVRPTANISNAKFYNNSATREGGAISFGNCDFALNNVTITNNYSNTAGGALLLTVSSIGTIDNCYIANNEGRLQAGAIQLYQGCQLDYNSGTIENNTSRAGGGFYASKNSVLRINGGLITNNKATLTNGGGIFANACEFYMTGGTVSNNYAKKYGGGIDLVATTVCKFTGGIISGNEVENAGGGICFNGTTTKDENGNVIDRICTVAEVEGVTISGNKAKNAGGFVEQSGAEVTFKNVKISKNVASNIGGGGYIGQYCKLNFVSGTVSGNDAKAGGGGGLYFQKSVDNVISGGTFCDNKCKGSGAGMYFLQSRAVLTGGTVSGNRSYNEKECYGGGLMIGGGGKTATGDRGLVELYGVTVKNNYALTCGGVCVSAVGNAIIGKGTTIKNNTANVAAGVLVQSEGSNLKMRGGTVSGNETLKSMGGGVFISTKTTFTMTGGTITGNKSATSAAGLTLLRCKANISGGTISNNVATTYGGGFYAQGAEANVSNLVIKDNTAETQAGGGICLTSVNVTQTVPETGKTYIEKLCNTITFKDCTVSGNKAGNAGGMVLQGAPEHKITIEGGEWCNNESTTGRGGAIYLNLGSLTINNASFHDNKAASTGGAIYAFYHNKWSNTEININGSEFYNNSSAGGGALDLLNRTVIKDSKFYNNSTTVNEKGEFGYGGGISVNARSHVDIYNTTITDNKAETDGGGLFVQLGGKLKADGLVITGNTAGKRGGGLCDLYETTVTNATITGNTAPEYAGMYIASGDYDGESYYMGPYKMGGNMIIKDNNGKYTGLYIPKGGVISTVNGIYDKDTDIHVNLESGVLTNTIIGQYNYEGGNLVYDLSYGDKSITDPEPIPVAEKETEAVEETTAAEGESTEETTAAETEESGSKGIMIAAIAVSAVAVIGGAIAIISNAKKKKEGQ